MILYTNIEGYKCLRGRRDDLCGFFFFFSSSQEERFGDPQGVGAEKRRGSSLAADALPLSHFHHRVLQPLEGREDFREGDAFTIKEGISSFHHLSLTELFLFLHARSCG